MVLSDLSRSSKKQAAASKKQKQLVTEQLKESEGDELQVGLDVHVGTAETSHAILVAGTCRWYKNFISKSLGGGGGSKPRVLTPPPKKKKKKLKARGSTL